MNYYISDTHFGHKNILRYDNRPFFNVQEMEDEMIKRWNDRVTNEDTVYILGDMIWSHSHDEWSRIVKKLKGNKILIVGNHDFEGIFDLFSYNLPYLEVKDGDKNLILCHFPILTYNHRNYCSYHLYGHVHASGEDKFISEANRALCDRYNQENRMFNVGCMKPYMDYTPRTLDEIIAANKK